jgi:integrase
MPATHLVVREYEGRPFWEAKFRDGARQVKRRLGPAWLVRPESAQAKPNGLTYKRGQWVQRRGRPVDGALSHHDAVALVPGLVDAYLHNRAQILAVADAKRLEAERPRTFKELAQAWRASLERKGTKPSTLVGYDAMLAEPGTAFRRGDGKKVGYIMAALGEIGATDVTVGDVEGLLTTIAETGATARTVEKHRIMVRSILNYGIRETKRARAGKGGNDGHDYNLTVNAAQVAEGPRQRSARVLVYYLPEEIDAIARALEQGCHRHAQTHHQPECNRSATTGCDCSPVYRVGRMTFSSCESARAYLRERRHAGQLRSDSQDAAAVRISAYTGLRLGELLALRWSDIDWAGSALTVSRAISARQESATKSGKIRRVPLPDQAVAALNDLSKRGDFTAHHELVVCNVITGRLLDGSALRRRYKEAQIAAGVHEMRWHDLRHTYGSLLAASGEELVTIKSAMGHANIATTEVYLHARPATELAARFTAAFTSQRVSEPATSSLLRKGTKPGIDNGPDPSLGSGELPSVS